LLVFGDTLYYLFTIGPPARRFSVSGVCVADDRRMKLKSANQNSPAGADGSSKYVVTRSSNSTAHISCRSAPENIATSILCEGLQITGKPLRPSP
jgi:hypothetical protein